MPYSEAIRIHRASPVHSVGLFGCVNDQIPGRQLRSHGLSRLHCCVVVLVLQKFLIDYKRLASGICSTNIMNRQALAAVVLFFAGCLCACDRVEFVHLQHGNVDTVNALYDI